MTITDVRIRIIDAEGNKLKALASITIDDCFVVHDIKVIEGSEGIFIAMPSRKIKDGTYKDIAHPISPATREMIKQHVFAAYRLELDRHEAAAAIE